MKLWRLKRVLTLNSCAIVFFCVAILLLEVPARAQVAGAGNVQGTVTDTSGAVIPGATVTLTDVKTQVRSRTQTDKSGVFAFPNIDISTYNLSVSATGFETYEQTGIVLEVGSSITVNPTLAVGRAEIKVEVQAEGLALQTEDASFKQTIDEHAVDEMPLNGRYLTGLLNLAGGVVNNASCGDCTGSKFPYQSITVAVGGVGNTTAFKLDGGDNNDYMGGGNLSLPFPDAVSQFSVESSALGAQDGMHSGGLVNVVTKSGTNSYHGSAFEFIRNNYIDATNFFASGKDTLHENEYGGTFGGKVLRDKLFAFAAYQREQDKSASATSTAYVPTAANLAGDWSNTDPDVTATGGTGVANNCGPAQQLYDPITGVALTNNKYSSAPVYNASALALMKYLPQPTAASDPNGCGRVQYAIPSQHSDNEFISRVDYTINQKNNFYGRYFIDGYQAPPFYSPTNILITTQSGNIERIQSLTFGENYTINSNTVNSAHLTGVRRQNTRGYAPNDINASALSITDFQTASYGFQFSSSTSSKNHGFSIGGGSNSKAVINDNTISVSDDLTMLRGKHQFVIGGEYVRNQLNLNNVYEGNGTYNFNGEYSGSGPTGVVGGKTLFGDANLDFLFGSMNSFQQSRPQQNALRETVPSLYIQDTLHATHKVTLVAGIRWEPFIFPVDYFHRGAVFNMNQFVSNQFSTVYPNAPAGIFFFGDTNVSANYTQNSLWQFNPNVGASYDPFGNGKWVIRGGLELAYEKPDTFVGQRVQQNLPFGFAAGPNTSQQICFSNPWLINGTGYGCAQIGGVQTSPFPIATVPSPSQAVFNPQSQYIVLPPQFHPQDSLQYTFSIQHEFARGWQAQIDYIGSHTQHTLTGVPLSPAVYTPGVWGAGGTGCGPVQTSGAAATAGKTVGGGAVGTPCSTTANQQARFLLTEANPGQGNQFVGGGGGSVLESNTGNINYNGMIATLQHRLSSTFSLLANYTWSKCLNNVDANADVSGTSYENPNNPEMDYGRCAADQRNIFNATLIAKSEFPIRGIAGYAMNNWELGPLLHINSGQPINVTEPDDSFTDVGNDRAVQVAGVNPYNYAKISNGGGAAATYATRSYLNQAAFQTVESPCVAALPSGTTLTSLNCAGYGTYGNMRRNALNGPMFFQLDGQISRIFPIHERYNLDLRLEAFNVLNHPDFSNPSSGTSNPSSPSTASGQSGSFGEITGTSNSARVFQGGIKFSF